MLKQPSLGNWLDRFLSSTAIPVLIGVQLTCATAAIGISIGGCVHLLRSAEPQKHALDRPAAAPRPGS